MKIFPSPIAISALVIVMAGTASAAMAQNPVGAKVAGQPGLAAEALVQKTCTACHAASQFTSQRHSREQWADTVTTMMGYGAQVSDTDFDPIVNYLFKNFGTGGPARPGAAQ